MSLLNLVEQYHAVRLAAYSLGQLTALVIPYISWRRTYQTGYAELLLILAHVDTRHHLLVVKQIVSQRTRQFGLAYTRSTQEYERAYRSLRVLKSRTAAAHCITHGTYSLVLTDYTLVQLSLQVQQFLTFGSLHLGNRNTRPARNYFGNILARNLLAQQLRTQCRQLRIHILQLLLQFRQFAIPYLSNTGIVTLTLTTLSLLLQRLLLSLDILYLLGLRLLLLPLLLHRGQLGIDRLQFIVYGSQFLLVVFPLDSLALDFQLLLTAHQLVQFLWNAVTLHTQVCGSLVHQVNRLVRQETVSYVTMAQTYGSDDGIILDTYTVMLFVTLLQSSQYAYAACHIRLVHHYRLETTLQSLVLLEILLILVQRSRTYAAQLTTRQRRLQYVGSIHRTLCLTSTHQGMNLVNEQDNLPFGLRHLVYDTLQTLLKLTLIFGTGNQRTHIQRIQLLALQILGHVTPQYTVSQSLDDSRLTRSRFAYQYRVVLGPS